MIGGRDEYGLVDQKINIWRECICRLVETDDNSFFEEKHVATSVIPFFKVETYKRKGITFSLSFIAI